MVTRNRPLTNTTKKLRKLSHSSSNWQKSRYHYIYLHGLHGGLNQEKYSKSCQGLGPIFFKVPTPEVFKTTFREIADFRHSETLDQTHILGDCLLNKVQFFQA